MLYVYLLKGEDEFDVEEHYLDFLPFNTLKLPFNTISNTRNKFYDKLIRRGEFSDQLISLFGGIVNNIWGGESDAE